MTIQPAPDPQRVISSRGDVWSAGTYVLALSGVRQAPLVISRARVLQDLAAYKAQLDATGADYFLSYTAGT